MSAPQPTICICCNKPGIHRGRGLIVACYNRNQSRGTLDRYPRRNALGKPWQPTGPYGRRMLDRYRELAAIRPPLSTERIAFELGVTERSVQRYAAAVRAQASEAA